MDIDFMKLELALLLAGVVGMNKCGLTPYDIFVFFGPPTFHVFSVFFPT